MKEDRYFQLNEMQREQMEAVTKHIIDIANLDVNVAVNSCISALGILITEQEDQEAAYKETIYFLDTVIDYINKRKKGIPDDSSLSRN